MTPRDSAGRFVPRSDDGAVVPPPPRDRYGRFITSDGDEPRDPHDRIDGRTQWGDLRRHVIEELRGHLAGEVTASEELLILRCGTLSAIASRFELHVSRGDKLKGEDLSQYLSTCNTLRRLLAELGMKRRAQEINPRIATPADRIASAPDAR